ncbi:MAG: hypothetical protein A2W90_09225 [Bacteroidetes bacterium GWF2_42_66]|nr:MAG: hypothetical protein A2W92_12200 [Bacteroidetes bacterium GWA2_42_15]OFY00587.1 MAG: hypothetical protein A2W89_20540 [Bacteroidetes bacterium GWE2_42_39]OFY42321.1 MAG: hypothetical protein A2W90_09225 [Bacteroidetes bacterium GWF2_42_66]HAZ02076.1 hypothetical protein [Marinilabiliales bacterium]HBL76476.1 hypothetical protein [Prolixibacteraceae bacterium]
MKKKGVLFFLILLFVNSLHVNVYSQNKIVREQSDFENFLPSGKFVIGTNYWASHAGPEMWSDWRPDIVEQDLKKLSGAGIKTLRVFVTWTDFQPLDLLLETNGNPKEFRIDEMPLPDDIAGKAGVNKKAVAHFEEFASLAEKYNMKLIVALLTGHMSGRNFIPDPFKLMNPVSNPKAIQWEIRFVDYFVSRFKDEPSIIAWELGNECDLLWNVQSSEEAWCWMSHITKTIKAKDQSRPVLSGISRGNPANTPWNVQDMSELMDVLTTHFYHTFTPYSEQEPLNTMRPILGPIIKNIEAEDIGGKPSFIEEFGPLGPSFGDDGPDGVKPGFLRSNLFSAWAHNCRGLFWWIAFDQGHLTKAPFDWNSRGSEYGLWYPDGSPKPVLTEIQKFSKFLSGFEYSSLPERIIDGVCILTEGQDNWAVAYSSFILAKQAGIDINYQYCSQPLKSAGIYFLPGINGAGVISKHRMQELLQKVKEGAILYISNDNGHIGPGFSEFTGIRIQSYTKGTFNDMITMNNTRDKLELSTGVKCILQTEKAKILAVDQNGNPAFTCNNYGKGKIFFLNYPLEDFLAKKSGVFDGNNKTAYQEIYNEVKKSMPSSKILLTTSNKVGFTEHIVNNSTRLIIAVNYYPSIENITIELKDGWKISKTFYGKNIRNEIELHPNDAVVFSIEKL